MRTSLFVALAVIAIAGSTLHLQEPLHPGVPTEWIDADTGHRVVRLTDDAGGSTLYFHDNAFSPQGDTLMVNTSHGIAIVDVAKIGTKGAKPEIVSPPRARGGYFARRTREIYYTQSGSGMISTVNIDTRQTRDVRHARGLVNADETLSVVKKPRGRLLPQNGAG